MRKQLQLLVVLFAVGAAPVHAADTARTMYMRALDQERTVRDEANSPTLADLRRVVASYERLVRRYPTSGYSDDALWQAGNLSLLAAERFDDDADTRAADRLFAMLIRGYPSSRHVREARAARETLENGAQKAATETVPAAVSTVGTRAAAPGDPVVLTEIHRALLPDGVRVTLDLAGEVSYHQEEVGRPRRVFFDFKGARAASTLQDATLKFDDDVVKEIRLGRHPQNTLRVVLDLDGVEAYTVYALYNPYRLVIDARRSAAVKPTVTANAAALVASLPAAPVEKPEPASLPAPRSTATPRAKDTGDDDVKPPLPAHRSVPPEAPPPAAPSANSNGKFSMSRQLGLGVSRVVIDAGHGGHDPGAQANGLVESELTLDVALRLQKLLEKQPGIEVVMTRDSDVFIPLQERTAIANREGADLFLSIHANASRSSSARGIETYFLNFAKNPEAEAVAARENAGSGQSMHSLPDIVKAIALNNKVNESRDFAEMVQRSMVRRLSAKSKQLKDLGVKQAPFVVLIGASMPSVLAEISFVTHKQEGSLLKTSSNRQQLAQALLASILSYQQSLKKMNAIARKTATY
jgi:N-acetylmuramoyl-L-alanine amidase